MTAESKKQDPSLTITVVYNNVPHTAGLRTAWGFAAVIETGTATVLFDTGGDGAILLENMRHLAIDPASVDAVVLSHIHGDHTGGLQDFLAHRSGVAVYVPQSFPAAFRRAVEAKGARVVAVRESQHLLGAVHSTGEMTDGTSEQALVVDTPRGLVVVTGCAHPGVVRIAQRATAYLNKEIRLLVGGFHLLGQSAAQTRATSAALRKLGVREVAPSHCTGEDAIEMFRDAWGESFIEGGCGAVIEMTVEPG